MRVLTAQEVPDKFSRELSAAGEGCSAREKLLCVPQGRHPLAGRGSASGFRRSARRTLRLFEESLRRLGSGYCIGPSCLLRASSLPLAGTLTASRFRLCSRRSLDAVAGRQADFEFDDLVPNGVGALVVGNRQKFPQAAARIRELWLVTHGLGRLRLVGCGLERRLFNGFFFIHGHIIARIVRSDPVLQVTPRAMWVFSSTLLQMLAQGDHRSHPAEAGGEAQQQGRVARAKRLEDDS